MHVYAFYVQLDNSLRNIGPMRKRCNIITTLDCPISKAIVLILGYGLGIALLYLGLSPFPVIVANAGFFSG